MSNEVSVQNVDSEDKDELKSQFASDKAYSVKEKKVLRYSNFSTANQEGTS